MGEIAPAAQPHENDVSVTLMRLGPIFIVKAISNTTHWIPGDQVTRELANGAMRAGWNVTLVDNDILQMMLGAATAGVLHG